MKSVLIVLALLVVMVTALPLLRLNQWWIRVFDFPRAQITLTGIALLAVYSYFWETRHGYESIVLGLLVLAVGYQVAKMIPYTRLMSKQVLAVESRADESTANPNQNAKTQNSLSLLVANVLISNRESAAFLALVRHYDPDVILTVETDDWWEQALKPLEEHYPHTLKNPLDNTYGMLVYSRLTMIDPQIRFILKDSIPSMHMQLVLRSNQRVFMHFVHPDPPNPQYATETTERDAEVLIIGREVEQRDEPTIIAGDFNDVAWSYTTKLFQKTSGLLDPRIGRGMYNTYNAKHALLRWPLDHVFHSNHFKLVHMEKGPAWGSDHFPIFIALSLEPGAEAEQKALDTNPREEAQVTEKINEGKQHRMPLEGFAIHPVR